MSAATDTAKAKGKVIVEQQDSRATMAVTHEMDTGAILLVARTVNEVKLQRNQSLLCTFCTVVKVLPETVVS